MKNNISKLIKFLGILVLLGAECVLMSCATSPEINSNTFVSLNTGKNSEGKIYTTWVFRDIQKVIVINSSDYSEKEVLSPGDWKYDNTTTELFLLNNNTYPDCIITVKGNIRIPNTFIFNDIDGDSDFLVVFENRPGIEGYDYNFLKESKSLVFRNDLILKEGDWYISYSTVNGMGSISDWKPENLDRLAYFEAEHRKRYLDSWYDTQEAFWFLDQEKEPGKQETKPLLVKRKATPDELIRMKSCPVSVLKYRGLTEDSELKKELGFDVSLPEIIYTENPRKEFRIFSRTIEEYPSSGVIHKKLNVFYEDENSDSSGISMINITLSPLSSDSGKTEKAEWIISEKEINLGEIVGKTELWAMQTYGIDEKPELVKLCSWKWADKSAEFLIEAESSEEEITESFIMEIIKARKKSHN